MADLTLDTNAARPAPARIYVQPETLVSAGLFVLVCGLSLFPLVRLVALAFSPDESGALLGILRDSWTSRAVQRALWNSLWASGFATLLAVSLGTGFALLLGLGRFRSRGIAGALLLSPLLVPSQIMALAWIELAGFTQTLLPAGGTGGNPLYSGGGIVFLMGIETMPITFLAVRTALSALPPDLIEAARLCGAGRARIVGSIVLPLVLPAILGGGALAFAASIGNFGIPALLGIPGRFPMLTTLAYQRMNGFGPSILPEVAAIALMLVLIVLAALALRALVLRWSAAPLERTGASLLAIFDGRRQPLAEATVWTGAVLIAVLPMLALAASSLLPALGAAFSPETLTLANYGSVLSSASVRRALVNSVWLSLAAAFAATLIALPLAFLSRMRLDGLARVTAVFAEGPFVMPGTVLGLALILVFLPPLPVLGISLYATPLIILLAYCARFLPLVLGPVAASLSNVDPALEEAARLAGAGFVRRLIFIAVPLAVPAAAAGALLAALTALNELTVSALLWSAGTETLGVMVFALQYEGNSGEAAALSVVSILLVLAAALLGRLVLGRRN
ncbi:MAG: iron ABC transporter permease [Methylobacterium mesophilicum]|nr:iron ABC transporter permease [Methylobacterium mesophilicum]